MLHLMLPDVIQCWKDYLSKGLIFLKLLGALEIFLRINRSWFRTISSYSSKIGPLIGWNKEMARQGTTASSYTGLCCPFSSRYVVCVVMHDVFQHKTFASVLYLGYFCNSGLRSPPNKVTPGLTLRTRHSVTFSDAIVSCVVRWVVNIWLLSGTLDQ